MGIPTLKQLEFLAAIVEHGTLAEAARKMHITAGSLSVAVDSLEKELGVQLLVRRRAKGAVLTSAGRELYEEIRKVLNAARHLEASAAAIRGQLVGELNIGCFDTLAPWLIPPILEHFDRHHPGVTVTVVEASSDALQSQLHEGKLDAAFMYQLHVEEDLERDVIAEVRLQLVLPASHRLATEEAVRFEQLGDEHAILLGLKPAPDLIMRMAKESGFTPNVKWRLRSVEAIRSLVGRGLGYTVIMGRPSGDTTYEGRTLVYKRIADKLPENTVQLVYPAGALQNAKVRELRDFAASELSGIADPMQHWSTGD